MGVFQRAAQGDAPQAPFRVIELQAYRGPHLFSHRPMIRIRVDLGQLEQWPTDRIAGFNGALLCALPGLAAHGCSCRQAGGFAARLRDGTWLGHVIEHVALELQALAGSPLSRGKTRSVAGHPGSYDVLYAYEEETLAIAAGAAAIRLVLSLLPQSLAAWEGERRLPAALVESPDDIEALVPALSLILSRNSLGPTTSAITDAARRRGIPITRLDRHSFVQLGYGARQKRIRASMTGETAQLSVSIAGNKEVTRQALLGAGLPAPRGRVARSADDAVEAARGFDGPVVVKPLDGNHGRGVATNLTEEEQIRAAFDMAARIGRVIIEEQLPGKDYRILVIGGHVVAVAERAPASVVGDGFHSIAQLIEDLNADKRRGEGHEKVLTRVKIDSDLRDMLKRQGKTMASVPLAGETVVLRGTANLSTGGTAIDRTDVMHPDNRLIAEAAVRLVGLDIAGVDFLCPDISRPVAVTGGGLVEINAAPGFRMHLAPAEGRARDVATPVVDMLFPAGSQSRVPIVAVTGTNGKSTTTRMIAAIMREAGKRVGMANTSGIYLDDLQLKAGDASGPRSAKMILRNPSVEVAVLETARGGILREGLAFDVSSVGVVLNVMPDHLGLKDIDTLEQLAAVKEVVARNVARRGTAVLNFDDPLVRKMARNTRSRIAWFSLGALVDASALAFHTADGGTVATLEGTGADAELVLHRHGERHVVARAHEIPATAGGVATFNIANALAAICATAALGTDCGSIAGALKRFASSFEDNPGRFNIIDDHPFRVVLDYAHNPGALRALGSALPALRPASSGRLIGMVAIPGDRRDEDLTEMGRIAAELFDHIVFREGPDGRGRPRGEVLKLMERGARSADTSATFESILKEENAVDRCLALGRAGDLLAILPTDVGAVHEQVKAFRSTREHDFVRA